MVSPTGQVVGIDMTPAMIKKQKVLLWKLEPATLNSVMDTPRHYQLRTPGLML